MWNWCLKELMVGCGVALVVCGGIWQDRRELLPAAKPVDLTSIPSQLEDWTAADFPLKERDVNAAGIDRYLGRDYVQAETGNTFKVLIVSGSGGPISVHPPEVCFAGQGYLIESVIDTVKIPATGDREHQFSTAIFRGPESTGGLRVQLFWSWSDSGAWRTPTNPRLAFARLPRLYKIYVSRALTPQQGRDDVQGCIDFMTLLLPEFEKLMAAATESPSTPAVPQPADDATATAKAGSLLPVFDRSRIVRRNVLLLARPMFAQFPDEDGDFRL